MIKNRLLKVALVFFGILLIGFLYYLLITYTKFHLLCTFHLVTGLYCPGCGMTRCVLSLIHGDIYQAFRYNELVLILLPFLLSYSINKVYKFIFQKKTTTFDKIPTQAYLILAIATILFGVLRNIPCFSFLAPQII